MFVGRLIVGSFQENCYIIADDETKEALIIDPGDEEDRILAEIQRRELTVKVVANTHSHADHIMGIAPIVKATGAQFMWTAEEQQFHIEKPPTSNAMITVRELPPPADRLLADGDEFTIGSLTFTAIFTPGHTPGGVCYYNAASGALFTGDTLFQGSIGRYDFNGGDGHQLLRSIKDKLLVLPDQTVVLPGHGDPSTIVHERSNNPFLQGWVPD